MEIYVFFFFSFLDSFFSSFYPVCLLLIILCYIYLFCMYEWCVWTCMPWVACGTSGQLVRIVLSFQNVGSGVQTQVFRLDNKDLNPLSHVASPCLLFFQVTGTTNVQPYYGPLLVPGFVSILSFCKPECFSPLPDIHFHSGSSPH